MNVGRAICIGGSQGGIEALRQILPDLPVDLNAIVAVALHRHVESSNVLARLLRADGTPAVIEPYDKQPLLAGAVYLSPADYHLLVDEHCLRLTLDDAENHARPSIDVLFSSAARTFGDRAMAIVLSDSNIDGIAGAERVAMV